MEIHSEFYKVVKNDLTSCCCNPMFPQNYITQYKVKEWTIPKVEGTKLFVFQDKYDAIEFLDFAFSNFNRYQLCIYECDVINPQKMRFIANFDNIPYFWDLFNKEKEDRLFDYGGYAPCGTYVADSVRLTKRIE